jgi:hypothetical protein
VQAHANPHLGRGQRGLSLLRCRHGIGGFRECVEERVALSVDLDTGMAPEGFTKQPAMLEQRLAVAITELLQEQRGSLDVSEQKGDPAAGKLAGHHNRSLRCASLLRQHNAPRTLSDLDPNEANTTSTRRLSNADEPSVVGWAYSTVLELSASV